MAEKDFSIPPIEKLNEQAPYMFDALQINANTFHDLLVALQETQHSRLAAAAELAERYTRAVIFRVTGEQTS